MDSYQLPFTTPKNRLGMHYFPDSIHYRDSDLQTWLPELESMGISWLVLQSPFDRAIPEHFIEGLIQAGIEPIIHFGLPLINPPEASELRPILSAYGRWGVKAVIFFDRPNSRNAWPATSWAQQDLVERFLDQYVPLACLASQNSLTPILPPLEPGGSYWDTAFLRTTLESLQKRKQDELLLNLVLSAYAWSGYHNLNWGAGGPDRWPEARPYFSLPQEQDQRGFRIFDWYKAITTAVLGTPKPILLLGAGLPADPLHIQSSKYSVEQLSANTLAIAQLLCEETPNDPGEPEKPAEAIPSEVFAAAFWLLSTGPNSPYQSHAWYSESGNVSPVVEKMKTWYAEHHALQAQESPAPVANIPSPQGEEKNVFFPGSPHAEKHHCIKHYLLLPTYEWGVADWHLDVIRPFVKKYRPTIGFSPSEASHAVRVTLVGNSPSFPDDIVEKLTQAGCIVERISGDGTSIATQLAER
ncbi:MAG: hypothetical protein GYA17_08500 [Chloroflexi bacterium]|jgi:hypothetical protein|nr:hypothetical protein [Anaerolineaceae bacterium]NMB88389.1 hypothetical protein [Chloroflexota bacterium]